jgi:uncharacterized protein DUF3450
MMKNVNARRRLSPLGIGIGLFVLAAVIVGGMRSGEAQEELDPGKVQDTRDSLEQWVETRRVISKEKADWKLGRELLEDQVELRGAEIATIRDRIAETRKSIADAQAKKAALETERDELRAVAKEFEEVVVELEKRALTLAARLPQPVLGEMRKAVQNIPAAGEKTELGLGIRYGNVIGVLLAINKFNKDIKIENEIRQLEDGTEISVQALYLGVGQAYYASEDGKHGGIGYATDKGWIWEARDDEAAKIALAIAVKLNKEPAAFVKLPLVLSGGEAK